MNLDKFSILFTICFVGYMNIVIILISDNSINDSDILVLIISGIVLIVFAYASSKKNPIEEKISPRNHLFFLIFGSIVGILIMFGINSTKDFDSQNSSFTGFLINLFVSIGSKAGLLFFSIMSMIVSILYVPYIKKHITGYEKTRWIPFIGGVTVGFGIMAIIDVALHGFGIA